MNGFLAQLVNIWRGTGSGGFTCNVRGPCDFCDALVVVSNIIGILFTIAIPLAVLMIVYGAIRMMIASGSPEQVRASRKIITSAVIGIIIALAAVTIVNTILHILTGGPDFPWKQVSC